MRYTDASGSEIAKSVDGGATWTVLTGAVPFRYTGFAHSFGTLAFDPENPSILWLADFAQVGPSIDRSADGGATWTDVHDFPAFFIGDSLGGSSELLVDPKDSSRLYACCIHRLDSEVSGFFRTDDGGATWVEAGEGVTDLQISPSGVLYALGAGVHASSSDHGQTWTNVQLPSGFNPVSLFVTASSALLVLDDSVGSFLRSTDGGSTWKQTAGPWGFGASIQAADTAGSNIYVGWPESSYIQHAFAAKLNSAGAVVWATLLAGSRADQANAIAVDASGNAYIAGSTNSPDFPLAHAFQGRLGVKEAFEGTDAFLSKISSDGSQLMYSTFLGGSGQDSANAVTVDSTGNVYLAGSTSLTGFPVANAIQPVPGTMTGSSWVAKFDSTGQKLLFSTYLGGTANGFYDTAAGIALDGQGNVWMIGNTGATGFPLVNAIQQGVGIYGASYVAELAPAGTGYRLAFSTYFGDDNPVASLAVVSSGSVWLVGSEGPNYGPTPPGGILARFDPSPQSSATGAPVINYVSNRASYVIRNTISPGELVTLTGVKLAPATASAQSLPLPANMQGTSVQVGGVAAPLLYVSPLEIDFQVPYEVGQALSSIVVQNGAKQSAPFPVNIVGVDAGIFMINGDYTAPLVAHASDFTLVTPQNPAHAGEYLAIFCTGLGVTDPAIVAGTAPTAVAFITAMDTSVVLNNLLIAVVPYIGVAPDFVGLYQVNFQVPANAAPGANLLYLDASNQVLIYVQ